MSKLWRVHNRNYGNRLKESMSQVALWSVGQGGGVLFHPGKTGIEIKLVYGVLPTLISAVLSHYGPP
jgi:hypothetical protein